jgi:hypothetical protein
MDGANRTGITRRFTLVVLIPQKAKAKRTIKLQLPYQEIMGLIGAGELQDALEKLELALNGVSDKYHQQVILFKSRLAENEENINLGRGGYQRCYPGADEDHERGAGIDGEVEGGI